MIRFVIVVAVCFLLVLWASIVFRRHAIRSWLLAWGAQTSAETINARRGRDRQAKIHASYVDNTGVRRTAVKTLISAGDAQLAKKPAVVLYDPRRPTRDDRVLLGFGETPSRWFGVTFTK